MMAYLVNKVEIPMRNDFYKKILQYLLPKKSLTYLAGFLANVKHQKIKNFVIERFIKQYQVNMSEALIEDPKKYSCFNDFFIRYLKPEARTISAADIVSPVDGCISEIGLIQKGQIIQAKGLDYSVEELLACNQSEAARYEQGQFATLYLAPKDYHRVHMPMDAKLISMTYIPGTLFSVQPATARSIPKLFARNERLVVFFETQIGPMAVVLVGATVVGAIGTSWLGDLRRCNKKSTFDYPDTAFKKADEMGYFKLGSTVILLFANGASMQWNPQMKAGNGIQFGQELGKIVLPQH